MKKLYIFHVLLLTLSMQSCFVDQNTATNNSGDDLPTLNIYTDRHYPIDDTIFRKFEKQYGAKINVVKGKSEDLLNRIDKEGAATKADIFLTADVGRIYQAKQSGFFQPMQLPENINFVPDYLYDEDGVWVGITKRARVIVHAKDFDASNLNDYEDLVLPEFKGQIAVRSKENIYNQSLLAAIIANNGEDAALEWVKGVVANMYQSPKGNDRDQVKAIYVGDAKIAIVNTYYLGHLLTSDDAEEVKAAQSIQVLFPNQSNRGTHINVSGGGVLQFSENLELAEKLFNFLLSEEVQKLYAESNFEFPARKGVPSSDIVSQWGKFKEDDTPLSKIGELNTQAIKLFDRGGWK
ncbi:MAG: extracellular solute-binding protein [Crocinitomicaceae bacterium]|nr:extracellular solute-binding protein [Crocinitomicaceae bacterium]